MPPHHQGLGQGERPGQQDRHTEQGGEQYLQQTDTKHQAAHGDESWQGELQTEGEHQKDDPQIAQGMHHLLIADRPAAIGAQQHTHQQVGEDRRQPEASEKCHQEDGDEQE